MTTKTFLSLFSSLIALLLFVANHHDTDAADSESAKPYLINRPTGLSILCGGETVAQIYRDGTVDVKGNPSDAAKAFWESVRGLVGKELVVTTNRALVAEIIKEFVLVDPDLTLRGSTLSQSDQLREQASKLEYRERVKAQAKELLRALE